MIVARRGGEMKHDLESMAGRDLLARITSPHYLPEEKLAAAEELQRRMEVLIVNYRAAIRRTA